MRMSKTERDPLCEILPHAGLVSLKVNEYTADVLYMDREVVDVAITGGLLNECHGAIEVDMRRVL